MGEEKPRSKKPCNRQGAVAEVSFDEMADVADVLSIYQKEYCVFFIRVNIKRLIVEVAIKVSWL